MVKKQQRQRDEKLAESIKSGRVTRISYEERKKKKANQIAKANFPLKKNWQTGGKLLKMQQGLQKNTADIIKKTWKNQRPKATVENKTQDHSFNDLWDINVCPSNRLKKKC